MNGPGALPPELREYLATPHLAPMWQAVRARLERNRLQPTGTVSVNLDQVGADRLSGLLGRTVAAGARRRISLADLDAALRGSDGGRGLVSVIEILDGRPVLDRAGARDSIQAEWAEVWRRLDSSLAEAGLADAPWVADWIDSLRRSGVLTRAGTDAADRALSHAVAGLGILLKGAEGPQSIRELGALASEVTGTAHGFDETTLAAGVLLRAAAHALERPAPETAADRRELWKALRVATDSLSGTVLAWQIRPPGTDGWSRMMRDRADLGLVTHLTLHELDVAGSASLAPQGQAISVCENPQVLQAAARTRSEMPLLCLSGNPAIVGTRLIRTMVHQGNTLRYHGDFDWPGVAIAARVMGLGAEPWQMFAVDYLAAVERLDDDHVLALTGNPSLTPWDPRLGPVMAEQGVAVHEEFVLPNLLADLR